MSKSLGEADSSTQSDGKDSSVECPTCGRTDFKSEMGVKQHHGKIHGESLSKEDVECGVCGDEFPKRKCDIEKDDNHYCSMGCLHESKRNGVELECEMCGDIFRVGKSREDTARVCSDACRGKLVGEMRSGINPYEYVCDYCGEDFKSQAKDRVYCSKECHNKSMVDKVDTSCAECGCCLVRWRSQYEYNERHFCDYDCRSEWMGKNWVGENNPLYINGTNAYRGNNWSQQRLKALKRDQARCQSCGVLESEKDRGHHVHHIVPYRKFDSYEKANELSNLVTLCESCHQRWEGIELKPQLTR